MATASIHPPNPSHESPPPPTSSSSSTSTLHTHLLRLQSSLEETTSLISSLRTITSEPPLQTQLPAQLDTSRAELSADIRARLHLLDEEFAGCKVRWEVLREVRSGVSGSAARGVGVGAVGGGIAVAKGWVGVGARKTLMVKEDERKKKEEGKDDKEREDGEWERVDVLVGLMGEDLKAARTAFRKAEITAKRAIEELRRQQRRSLLHRFDSTITSPTSTSTSISPTNLTPTHTSTSDSTSTSTSTLPPHHPPLNRSLRPSNILSTTSQDITSSLRRTHSLLTSSLSTSHFAQQTLAQSTAALEALTGTYSDLDGLLKSTGNVLAVLIRSSKSDTWYLMTSFWMLVGTVAWLVVRRWLWVVLWGGWYLLKMLVYGGKGGVGVGVWFVGLMGGSGREEGMVVSESDILANKSVEVELQGMNTSQIKIQDEKDEEEEQRTDALEYIDKIATEMHSGAGIQTTEGFSTGEAIPVDDVPGDPALHRESTDHYGNDHHEKDIDRGDTSAETADKERRKEGLNEDEETTLPPPESDAHLPRNPKKRVLEEEEEQVQDERVRGLRDEL